MLVFDGQGLLKMVGDIHGVEVTDSGIEAMAMAPIPAPEVLWRKPPVLALAALPGTAPTSTST